MLQTKTIILYVHNVLGKFSLCCILLREICENKRPLIEILDDCLYYAHNCGQVSNMLQNKRFKKKKMMFLMLPMFPYTTFVPMNERCAKRLAIRGDGWVNYESLSMTNGSQPTPTAYNYLHKQMMSFWYFICFFFSSLQICVSTALYLSVCPIPVGIIKWVIVHFAWRVGIWGIH